MLLLSTIRGYEYQGDGAVVGIIDGLLAETTLGIHSASVPHRHPVVWGTQRP